MARHEPRRTAACRRPSARSASIRDSIAASRASSRPVAADANGSPNSARADRARASARSSRSAAAPASPPRAVHAPRERAARSGRDRARLLDSAASSRAGWSARATPDRLPQLRDVHVKCVVPSPRIVTPQPVDQAAGLRHAIAVQYRRTRGAPRRLGGQRNRFSVANRLDLDRAGKNWTTGTMIARGRGDLPA